MTLDELVHAAIEYALAHVDEVKAAVEEYRERGDENQELVLFRKFPVHYGETEAQAGRKNIAGLYGANDEEKIENG